MQKNSLIRKIRLISEFMTPQPGKRTLATYCLICFFFLSGFSFTGIHDSQDSRGRGKLSH